MTEQVRCDNCGSEVQRRGLSKHKKTLKCMSSGVSVKVETFEDKKINYDIIDTIPMNGHRKESLFNYYISNNFPIYSYNKSMGESGRRPDWVIKCKRYWIIIELDEYSHNNRSISEELKRIYEIHRDIKGPIFLIRINPDLYYCEELNLRLTCFQKGCYGNLYCNRNEFKRRINKLFEVIKEKMNEKPTEDISIIPLFYDN